MAIFQVAIERKIVKKMDGNSGGTAYHNNTIQVYSVTVMTYVIALTSIQSTI